MSRGAKAVMNGSVIAKPAGIDTAHRPTCTEPMYPTPAHLSAARRLAETLPSRVGNRLHYPGGRVTDMDGNVLEGPR